MYTTQTFGKSVAPVGHNLPVEVKHIPKPSNMFVVFRSAVTAVYNCDRTATSKTASTLWNKMPKEGRDHFQMRAKQIKAMHKLIYPHYQCTPKQSKKGEKSKKKSDDDEKFLENDPFEISSRRHDQEIVRAYIEGGDDAIIALLGNPPHLEHMIMMFMNTHNTIDLHDTTTDQYDAFGCFITWL